MFWVRRVESGVREQGAAPFLLNSERVPHLAGLGFLSTHRPLWSSPVQECYNWVQVPGVLGQGEMPGLEVGATTAQRKDRVGPEWFSAFLSGKHFWP